MPNVTKSKPAVSRQSTRASKPEPEPVPFVPRPSGKLRLMIDRLSAKRGATAGELTLATGWQRHSVLGALSRLRTRGFAMQLDVQADRTAYRLTRSGG